VKRVKWIAWCAVGLWLVAPAAPGAAPQAIAGEARAAAAGDRASLEREAWQIETMLIAPCCWREQVSVHQSEAAEQVKREIRDMLAAGMARQQVLDAFVARYGARILAEPPDSGVGLVLYHAPWILGLGSALGVVLFIRRITRRPANPASAGGTVGPGDTVQAGAPDADTVGRDAAGQSYEERLDEELRALD